MPPARRAQIELRLDLPFERRQRTRLRTKLASGEEVALMMPRGEVLRGGDVLATADDRLVLVVAAAEQLLHIECDDPRELARVAYHLGNRHVPVEVGNGCLRIAADHVLEAMARGLGARVGAVNAAFEPESGAYHSHSDSHGDSQDHDHGHAHQHGHGHLHSEDERPGRIHEYGIDPKPAGGA